MYLTVQPYLVASFQNLVWLDSLNIQLSTRSSRGEPKSPVKSGSLQLTLHCHHQQNDSALQSAFCERQAHNNINVLCSCLTTWKTESSLLFPETSVCWAGLSLRTLTCTLSAGGKCLFPVLNGCPAGKEAGEELGLNLRRVHPLLSTKHELRQRTDDAHH